jgi:hypothetical protein
MAKNCQMMMKRLDLSREQWRIRNPASESERCIQNPFCGCDSSRNFYAPLGLRRLAIAFLIRSMRAESGSGTPSIRRLVLVCNTCEIRVNVATEIGTLPVSAW